MEINRKKFRKFRKVIWQYYQKHGRHDMPWRHTRDPYKILVSEIMLQQTQVKRVEKFYPKFVKTHPDFRSLARAPLKSVLKVWQGMGYNRRAMALKKLAQMVMEKYQGKLPTSAEELTKLPGIGHATAGAIMTYAHNLPVPFIETNIRRTFIYHFFRNKKSIDDKEIMKLVEAVLDKKNPREWCWALMDYGSFLASQSDNPNRRSSSYAKQSKFEGSKRQIRGSIVKLLLAHSVLTAQEISSKLKRSRKSITTILDQLVRENFLNNKKGTFSLTE